jgi:phosphoribosylanthranilate isomerase
LIKAFSVKTPEDLLCVSEYEGLCACFLFDTPTNGYGGSGKRFDWHILHNYSGLTPFLLSGGIGPESLQLLKEFNHHRWHGIDLNSRFENAPAQKNIPLLTDFVHQFKNNQL